jgi:hypothetical protein
MGYDTTFEGSIGIEPPLNPSEISFLIDFNNSRRQKRSKGPLYVNGTGYRGQGNDDDVLDGNRPDPDQPGLWCQWVPSEDGSSLEWDGVEKFYHSAEWMKYIVENLLGASAQGYVARHVDEDPRLYHFTFNHVLNGQIEAQGEESDDMWLLVVEHNVVKVAQSETIFGKPIPI